MEEDPRVEEVAVQVEMVVVIIKAKDDHVRDRDHRHCRLVVAVVAMEGTVDLNGNPIFHLGKTKKID